MLIYGKSFCQNMRLNSVLTNATWIKQSHIQNVKWSFENQEIIFQQGAWKTHFLKIVVNLPVKDVIHDKNEFL